MDETCNQSLDSSVIFSIIEGSEFIPTQLIGLRHFGGGDWMLLFKNLAYTIIVPSTFAIYIPWLMSSEDVASTGILRFISSALFLLGGIAYSWSVWSFASIGQGTPAPFDAPTHLVIRGLYNYTRNPMYGSIMTLLLGWMTLFPSLGLLFYGLSIGACFHLFVVLYEEPHLKKIFGDSYDKYLNQVGRWIPIISKDKGK